ncbi:MAG: hypothetical protein RIQ81_364 [Pseudomonadota bacterium]|jgi:hypothetical protein
MGDSSGRRARFLFFNVLCVLSAWIFDPGRALAVTMPRKYRVATGATMAIALPGVRRLRINREGVIHARRADGDQWVVTGLAKGVVLLQPERDPASGAKGESNGVFKEPAEIVVEVFSAPIRAPEAKRAPGTATDSNWPPGCDSMINEVDAVRFKIVMDSTQSSSAGGVSPAIHVEGQLGRVVGTGLAGGASVLQLARGVASIASNDRDGKVRAKVIAEPRLALFPGAEAMVRSGGEFRTDGPVVTWSPARSERHVAGGNGALPQGWHDSRGWKEYGLSLRASWLGCHEGRAAVEYEVWLTQRVSGSEDHLLTGRISGKRLLAFRQSVFGGSIDFALDAGSSTGSWWISHMPFFGKFLGDLLSSQGEEKGNSQMTVWLGLVSPGEPPSELEVQPERGSAASEAVE